MKKIIPIVFGHNCHRWECSFVWRCGKRRVLDSRAFLAAKKSISFSIWSQITQVENYLCGELYATANCISAVSKFPLNNVNREGVANAIRLTQIFVTPLKVTSKANAMRSDIQTESILDRFLFATRRGIARTKSSRRNKLRRRLAIALPTQMSHIPNDSPSRDICPTMVRLFWILNLIPFSTTVFCRLNSMVNTTACRLTRTVGRQ